MALAAGTVGYTPTAAALKLRHAGQLLPMWWAEPGDVVLVDDEATAAAGREMARRYLLEVEPVVKLNSWQYQPMPWGWSAYTARELERRGVVLLPTPEELEQMRLLSSRRTTIAIHQALGTPTHFIPVEAFSVDEAVAAIDRYEGRAVAKLPWSSSGRGVIYADETPRDTLVGYLSGIINRQGSVMVEPRLDRITDFATLFYSNGREVEYRGLSLFRTDDRGSYHGNYVDSQEGLAAQLGVDVTVTTARLEQILTKLVAPHYKGWMGVDMMLHRLADGSVGVAECIELNLRCTMGVAALAISQCVYASTGKGYMSVAPGRTLSFDIDMSPVPDAAFAISLHSFEPTPF